MTDRNSSDLLTLTAEVVAAHVANNRLGVSELPGLIASVHGALSGVGKSGDPSVEPGPDQAPPAVSVRKSLADPTRIISMIDGKPYTMLKRHLGTNGLTPDQYRARFGLKPDYPMVAPAYAEKRRGIAVKTGLGRKAKVIAAADPELVPEPTPTPPKRRKLKISTSAQH